MSMLKMGAAGMIPMLLTSCAMMNGRDGMTASAADATADVRNAAGAAKARVDVSQVGDSVRVRIAAMDMVRGTYAAHVHTTGTCTGPDFSSAGPHWNPTGQQHGKDNPAGMHKGDLPNLEIGGNGRGSIEYSIVGARLAGGSAPLLDADGAAIVIHAQADDYRSDPAGNAGARIACGVLRSG
jgi:Cu-Zn family superoxide dismutase